MKYTLLLFTLFIAGTSQSQPPVDTTYVLYCKKKNSNTHTIIQAGDIIKVTTISNPKEKKHEYKVVQVIPDTLIFEFNRKMPISDLNEIIKPSKKATTNGIILLSIGTVLTAWGIHTSEFTLFGNDNANVNGLTWVGEGLIIAGFITITPPKYSRKKKSMMQVIEKKYILR